MLDAFLTITFEGTIPRDLETFDNTCFVLREFLYKYPSWSLRITTVIVTPLITIGLSNNIQHDTTEWRIAGSLSQNKKGI